MGASSLLSHIMRDLGIYSFLIYPENSANPVLYFDELISKRQASRMLNKNTKTPPITLFACQNSALISKKKES